MELGIRKIDGQYMGMGQNPGTLLVHTKIAGKFKWMFDVSPHKYGKTGFDPSLNVYVTYQHSQL